MVFVPSFTDRGLIAGTPVGRPVSRESVRKLTDARAALSASQAELAFGSQSRISQSRSTLRSTMDPDSEAGRQQSNNTIGPLRANDHIVFTDLPEQGKVAVYPSQRTESFGKGGKPLRRGPTGAGMEGSDERATAGSGAGRVLQVDRTEHAFVAGVRPAQNLNPGGAAARLARTVARRNAQRLGVGPEPLQPGQAAWGEHSSIGSTSLRRARPASSASSRSVVAGTWNDWTAGPRGGTQRRPASAGAPLTYAQEHHPFETSFPFDASVSFWEMGGGVNPAEVHPGIRDEDLPTFGREEWSDDGASVASQRSSPPPSHHHSRVGDMTHGFRRYEAEFEAGAEEGQVPRPDAPGSPGSWQEEMSLLSDEPGDGLSEDVLQRSFPDRREASYVDVLGQRPMPRDDSGYLRWGGSRVKAVFDDHNPALKTEDMRRKEADLREGQRMREKIGEPDPCTRLLSLGCAPHHGAVLQIGGRWRSRWGGGTQSALRRIGRRRVRRSRRRSGASPSRSGGGGAASGAAASSRSSTIGDSANNHARLSQSRGPLSATRCASVPVSPRPGRAADPRYSHGRLLQFQSRAFALRRALRTAQHWREVPAPAARPAAARAGDPTRAGHRLQRSP